MVGKIVCINQARPRVTRSGLRNGNDSARFRASALVLEEYLVHEFLSESTEVYDLLGLALGLERARDVNGCQRRCLGERHIPEPITVVNCHTFSLHQLISFRFSLVFHNPAWKRYPLQSLPSNTRFVARVLTCFVDWG